MRLWGNCIIGILVCWLGLLSLTAQSLETEIKVYDFDDGLSHRNVFQITQDSMGIMWMATINGLNRFDGYLFKHFSSSDTPEGRLPVDVVSELVVRKDGHLWLASPDFITAFDPHHSESEPFQIKPGDVVRRESLAPHNFCIGPKGKLWCTVYDEKSGENQLATFQNEELSRVAVLPGASTNRAIVSWQNQLIVAAFDNQIWSYSINGRKTTEYEIGTPTASNPSPRIVDLKVVNGDLWALLNDGRVFSYNKTSSAFEAHYLNSLLENNVRVGALMVEKDGDIWLGGLGTLLYYDEWRKELMDYDGPIRQLVKNTCTYRSIYQDASEVVWLSTDFGAIKVTQSDKLFTQYLSGGSEYCSNVYCSTRGLAEGDNGEIYIAYYNSIHVLDPENNAVKPLFPNNDYFNFPFGIAYHNNTLYTGNGIKINLETLQRDTLFSLPSVDLGAIIVDAEEQVWIGYMHQLFQYNPFTEQLKLFEDEFGTWDSLSGTISYLYQNPSSKNIWVGTLENGMYRIDPNKGRTAHFTHEPDSPVVLPHPQVNAIYEDEKGMLWVAGAKGLYRIDENQKLTVFTTEDGLPNNFINGLLPESDSCLWASTDNGLCRFSISDKDCTNFFTTDGLSSNEFNRISFFKSSDDRLYFGGLNGVNAFMPDVRYLNRKRERMEAPLLLTQFSYLDGQNDSLIIEEHLTDELLEGPIQLSYRDRMFTANVTMADYRQAGQNSFQFRLEGYDLHWSVSTKLPSVRYTDIGPGKYILRVRGKAGKEDWNSQELAIPIHIKAAYYQNWWFWVISGLLGLGLFYSFFRYRLYSEEKRREELEILVQSRTKELEAEKHKSEELLLNILPAEMAEELKKNGFAKARRHELVTVMFSDFSGFSRISKELEPEDLVAEIDLCFRAFDEITERHGLEKIKTIGDAYLLVGGISSAGKNEAKNVVKAAMEIQEFMEAISVERKLHDAIFFEARIGIHSGPLVAGIVGIKKFAYDIWGDTVNIASRMETNGSIGKVNLSETTYKLVKENFDCSFHGIYTEDDNAVKMFYVEDYLGD